ncbi:TonB-dependent receptor domain-containing protein [Capnocytophaga sp. oral taxon 338]|uniref:TonB-dependent receptor n=1 Tax=Capnocytophaga sp. oral taxon 338 TaxID=710239 RepID=UPI000202B988|nr:TonB-dependent receptor [Capnocytophaga sp. oral taxon 338]EGD35206.1 TonB-dependent receptor [Capnocytophaga sp. oral taxon 338 str. F0234]
MSKIFIIIGCFFSLLSVRAQYSFSGKVIDCQTKEPLSGVTIELTSLKKKLQTDVQGRFSFQGLPRGTHHFYVTQDDYEGSFFKVSLKRDEKNYIFTLCRNKEVEVGEVVVTATRTERNLKNVPITVQVITAKDIQKSQAPDFQSFLENEFSGINFTYNGGMPNINMMGFGGKYVLFLMDGERMAGETFDNIDYDRIDLDNIERIEIIKGASSSLYGSNALGGVINIITKETQKPLEMNVGYLYNTKKDHKANLSLGTKQKWGSIRLSSFYNFREPYILTDKEPLKTYKKDSIIYSEKGELNVAGYTNYGFTPKVGLDFSPKWNLTLTPSYYFSERNSGTESSKKLRDRYYNYTIALKSDYKIKEDKTLSLSGAYDRYDKFKYYRILKEKDKNYENSIWRAGGQYNQSLYKKHSLVVGAEMSSDELLSFRFNNTGTEAKKNAQNYTLFTQQEWALSDAFTLVTGVRMDYHSLFKGFLTYRLSGMFKIEAFTFRGGYSTGFRSPTLKELYTNWFHPWGGGFQIMGNKDLKPEKSNNINFSVDFNAKKWNITAMTQYSKVKDKIAYHWSRSNDTIRYINFDGNTDIISSEFSGTYRPNKSFRFKGSYAYYVTSKSRDDVRPHTFTLKAEYVEQTDMKYLPNIILSGKYVSETNIYEEGDAYTYYPSYSIWRLQFSKKLPYHLTLNAGIDNLFDYITKTTSFYSSVSPGRTYFVGLKWNL